jgi:hypothetical protein
MSKKNRTHIRGNRFAQKRITADPVPEKEFASRRFEAVRQLRLAKYP